MIVKNNKKKGFSFLTQGSESKKNLARSITNLVPVGYRLKKIIGIILLTVIVWSFLFSVLIYRKSHTPGFEQLALALNLKGRDVKHKTSESFKQLPSPLSVGLGPIYLVIRSLSLILILNLNICKS
jgi:hypothetical protein